ncbi:MAG: glycoside hydrolase family 25 protein [Actinomycetota bacterium]
MKRALKQISIAVAMLVCVPIFVRASADPFLLGVDVSHWDGSINWTSVALDSQHISFAVMEASWGEHGVDPRYASNWKGALSSGLLVAAYHFAYPDPSAGEAVREADHFVDVAAIANDRVIPALDIEGASLPFWPKATSSQLISWVRTWLDRVRARTGLRAMVYTSPDFWASRFANSDAIAKAGYPLWIAHWFVSQPRVPANDWNGDGWRCWQYTDSGRVSGIAGSVDLDHLDPQELRSIATNGV